MPDFSFLLYIKNGLKLKKSVWASRKSLFQQMLKRKPRFLKSVERYIEDIKRVQFLQCEHNIKFFSPVLR